MLLCPGFCTQFDVSGNAMVASYCTLIHPPQDLLRDSMYDWIRILTECPPMTGNTCD